MADVIYGKTVGDLLGEAASSAIDFARKNPFDAAALSTMTIPVVGDVTGLLADANMYTTQPEERNLLNYGLTAASLLPFIPAVSVMKKVGKAKPKTDKEKAAQKILDLLADNRADEVTDEMLEKADPKYLSDNYDLPMDTESRLKRAEEMGFDVDRVMYSGQQKDIKSFDQSDIYDELNHVWMSDNPAVAGTYIGRAKTPYETPSIFPFYTREPDYVIEGLGSNWENLPKTEIPDEILNFYGADKNINTEDVASTIGGSVEFRNITDVGPNMSFGQPSGYDKNIPSTTRADSDPAYNVRSIFARFDPRLSHLGNLSAGLTGGVVLTPAMLRGLLSTDEDM